MTPDEMSRLTLADLEEIAQRFRGAVETIQEAKKLLGMSPIAPDGQPVVAASPARAPPPSQLLPEEVAQRQRLLQQFRQGLPDEIRALENS